MASKRFVLPTLLMTSLIAAGMIACNDPNSTEANTESVFQKGSSTQCSYKFEGEMSELVMAVDNSAGKPDRDLDALEERIRHFQAKYKDAVCQSSEYAGPDQIVDVNEQTAALSKQVAKERRRAAPAPAPSPVSVGGVDPETQKSFDAVKGIAFDESVVSVLIATGSVEIQNGQLTDLDHENPALDSCYIAVKDSSGLLAGKNVALTLVVGESNYVGNGNRVEILVGLGGNIFSLTCATKSTDPANLRQSEVWTFQDLDRILGSHATLMR